MTERRWQDTIVADRMEVDQQFGDRLRRSRFSSQQWGLIMTAVDFEIEGEGENAELVADTSRIESMMPELSKMNQQTSSMSNDQDSEKKDGLFTAIINSLGIGSRVNKKALREATQLVEEYATRLQETLEKNGKWKQVKKMNSDQASKPNDTTVSSSES